MKSKLLQLDIYIYSEGYQKKIQIPTVISYGLKLLVVSFNMFYIFTDPVGQSKLSYVLVENCIFVFLPIVFFFMQLRKDDQRKIIQHSEIIRKTVSLSKAMIEHLQFGSNGMQFPQ